MEGDPRSNQTIEMLKKFLIDLTFFVEAPKIHEMIIEKNVERTVEKDRFVKLSSEA